MNFFHALEAWLLDGLARQAAILDPDRRKRIAHILSAFTHDIIGIRVHHVRQALNAHLRVSQKKLGTLAKKVYASFFENALEMASIPYLAKKQILERIIPLGLENLEEAKKRNKGVIIVSGHYGLWEMVPPWLTFHGYHMTSVVRNQSNKAVDAWMDFMRTSHGAKTTDSGFGLREILRTLKNGDLLGLMSDQDSGDKGIFVPFLGETASCPVGPAQIARKTGAPLVVVGLHRRLGQSHLLEFSKPIFPETFPKGLEGDRLITMAYNRILEEWIRSRPDQWFWLHRRWKTKEPNPKRS